MDYSKLVFPIYEYHEYPKWVEGKDGPVIVQNAEEEKAVTEDRPRRGRKPAEAD